jgi:hypothetical protein
MNRTPKIIKSGERKPAANGAEDDKISVSREDLLQLRRSLKGTLSGVEKLLGLDKEQVGKT